VARSAQHEVHVEQNPNGAGFSMHFAPEVSVYTQ